MAHLITKEKLAKKEHIRKVNMRLGMQASMPLKSSPDADAVKEVKKFKRRS